MVSVGLAWQILELLFDRTILMRTGQEQLDKKCKTCGEVSKHLWNKNAYGGRWRSECAECHNVKRRQRYRVWKRAVSKKQIDKKCKTCGQIGKHYGAPGGCRSECSDCVNDKRRHRYRIWKGKQPMELHVWKDNSGYSIEVEAAKFDLTWEGFKSLISALNDFAHCDVNAEGGSYRVIHLDLEEVEDAE